jgi:integrase
MSEKKKRSTSRRTWGSIRKTASGRYQARYRPFPGADYMSAPHTFRTKAEADAWLVNIRADLARGEWFDPKAGLVPFGEFAIEWLRTRRTARGPLAESTRATYRKQLARILVKFEKTALAQINAEAVRRWHATLGNIPATQAHAYALFKSIMATAVADGRIRVNPCQIDGASRYTVPKRRVGVQDEILAAAALMPEHERVWVLLACWGGMRRGELLGLRRAAIDVETQTILIGPTYVEVDGKMVAKPTPKSGEERSAVVPKLIMDAVVAHLDAYVDDDPMALVFTSARGGPARTGTIYTHWYAARRAIGRPDLTMHDLRHSGSTIRSTRGGATLREQMAHHGWAKPDMAIHYDHVVDGRALEIAEALNGELVPDNVVALHPAAPGTDRVWHVGGTAARVRPRKTRSAG